MKIGKKHICLTVAVMLTCMISISAWAAEEATRDECVDMCKKAAALVKEVGAEEALKQIGDPNGKFMWKGTYVFSIDIKKATVTAHPANPKLVGKTLSTLKDINGKLFFSEFINVAKNKGDGWVDYMWPKPGEKKPSPKVSYVYRVPGTDLAMIAGIYE